jgi:hypothetical protein
MATIDLAPISAKIPNTEPELLVGTGVFSLENNTLYLPCYGYDYYLFRFETKND